MAKLSFGATLRKSRDMKGMSLRKTAAAARISPTYLAQLERDASIPSEDVVFALADALGYDADRLLALTGRIAEDVLDVIRKHPRATAQLILAVKGFSEDKIMEVVQFAETRKRT
jgi:transcriptional regulator with XRE-family HTH domain